MMPGIALLMPLHICDGSGNLLFFECTAGILQDQVMARLLYPSATPLPRYTSNKLRQLPDLRQLSYIRIKYPLRNVFCDHHRDVTTVRREARNPRA